MLKNKKNPNLNFLLRFPKGRISLAHIHASATAMAKYYKKNRIDGKVVIITGCDSGLGKAAAIEIAKRGAKLYLACLDMASSEATKVEIIALSKNPNVFARQVDLGSLESIRSFAQRFNEEETKLHILMNNAGLFMVPKSYTKDGFEQTMGVNHLGHFLLTNLLLDFLKQSAPSRIVMLTSLVHSRGKINKNDFLLERSFGQFQAYCNSKLANILFTIHLDKQLAGTGVTINAVHPGISNTDICRTMTPVLRYLRVLVSCWGKSPKSGAQTQLMVALDPDLETVSGKYFVECNETDPAPHALDYEMAQWLWDKSAELTGWSG